MDNTEFVTQLRAFYLNAKYRSFTVWQVVSALQICIIVALIGTIAYKGYINNQINTQIKEGNVAGISIEKYSVPSEVNISIEDITKSFDPLDFGFEYKAVKNQEGENKIIKTIRNFIKKEDPNTVVYDKYLEFDQTKFSYWLKANFATLEKEVPQKPEIIFFDDSNQISECIIGYSTKKIPIQTIINDIKTYKQIPEDLYFVVDVGVLAEEEQAVNDVCNKINLFKRNLRKVKIKTDSIVASDKKTTKDVFKSYDFMDEEEANKIFSFHIIKEELITKIAKKDLLRQSIERVKKIFDQKSDTKQIRIEDKLIIIGEEKEIILINTEESIRVAENLLLSGDELENFPLIIEKNDGIYNSEQVLKFPKKIASSEVKIPTLYQKDAIKMSQLIDLYNNLIIKPGETYSFRNHISDAKLSEYLTDELPMSFNTPDGKVEYYKSLEPISTLLFRLALDSGLPFIERYQNVLNKDINHFGYPVSEMPLVNITGKNIKDNGDGTIKTRDLDLKFVNPSNQPIFVTIDYEFIDNNQVIFKAEMYTTQQFNSVNVQIKNFTRDVFDSNGLYKGYFIVFDRFVNDTDEVYSIYYYDDLTPKITPTPDL
ncbi:VanW family protein [Candidatus Dojkabacteria bacterium]|nr:VanW family protein [Candidatus Dojkabacteria bacterium]